MPTTIRILVVDDHLLIRDGVRAMLSAQPDLQVISEASDGFEAVQRAMEHLPDVVVLDISMPNLNGFDAAQQIRLVSPTSSILFFSNHHPSPGMRTLCIEAGGLGYVLKDDALRDLANAIRVVNGGNRFFGQVSAGVRNSLTSQVAL
jgi:DNA-binding NarL/FixJ family response regulator